MKTIGITFFSLTIAALLSGCLTVSQHNFSFDFDTGEIRRVYYDLTSRPGPDERDYSVASDWATLKHMIAEQKSEFDPEVVVDIYKGLFEGNKVLCAQKIQKVKCPRCFPSKASILSYVHDKEWRFEMINEEVILYLPSGKKIVSTNGQKLATPKNALIIWPQETRNFEYIVAEHWSGGTSLLSYYLEENDENE